MENKNILLIGLPESGKTTYIGALWNYINSIMEKKSIELHSLEGVDTEYLDSIADKWSSCEKIDRNYRTTPISKIQMKVKIVETNSILAIDIPDLSGETIGDTFEHREWSIEFDELAKNTLSIIMFVSVLNSNNKPTLLIHANEIEDCLDTISATSNIKPVEYNPQYTCNQVKLVEALQLINLEKEKHGKINIGVVVSAWDRAIISHGKDYKPSEWISKECPLLYQFLCSNDESFDVSFFGISAQGGDYDKEKADLIKKELHDRIMVISDEGLSFDIAKPIVWLTRQK